MKNVINKHKSNKIKENSNTVRHLNNGTNHRHSKSCCDQSSPARRTMIAAHLSGITNVKKFSIVIIDFIYNLGQYNLVQLIVMYAFIRNWSFQICLHMHPKSFDAGLNAHKTAIKCPRKRPPNAHKNVLKCTQNATKLNTKTHMPSSCTITIT